MKKTNFCHEVFKEKTLKKNNFYFIDLLKRQKQNSKSNFFFININDNSKIKSNIFLKTREEFLKKKKNFKNFE